MKRVSTIFKVFILIYSTIVGLVCLADCYLVGLGYTQPNKHGIIGVEDSMILRYNVNNTANVAMLFIGCIAVLFCYVIIKSFKQAKVAVLIGLIALSVVSCSRGLTPSQAAQGARCGQHLR